MQQNKMNVTLTAEQKATILSAVEALEDAIPFRLSLDNTERRRLLKLGSKSEGFVRQALEAARNHPEFIPASISRASFASGASGASAITFSKSAFASAFFFICTFASAR